MKAILIEAKMIGIDGRKREFTEAINLEFGMVQEIRYKGYVKDIRNSVSQAQSSSKDALSTDAQSFLDEV